MAGKTWRADVELQGWTQLRRNLNRKPPLHAPTWQKFVTGLGKIAVDQAWRASPVGETHRLQNSNQYKVDPRPVPSYVVIKNTARAAPRPAKRQNKQARAGQAPLRMVQGYRYPGRLNWDQRVRTHGWFTKAIQRARQSLQPLLIRAARELEQEWQRSR